jgi:hypothetical protein
VIEHKWLARTDPQPILNFLLGKVSERKLRLLSCAFARHCWWQIASEEDQNVVELTERFVDGPATPEEWKADDVIVTFKFKSSDDQPKYGFPDLHSWNDDSSTSAHDLAVHTARSAASAVGGHAEAEAAREFIEVEDISIQENALVVRDAEWDVM